MIMSGDDIQSISEEVAGRVAAFAMLSSNCYHKDDRVKFAVEKLGWVQVDWDGSPTSEPSKTHSFSGLAYDIFEKQGSNEVVFAFRGTDSKNDYLTANFAVPPFNFQYRQARKEFGRYIDRNTHKNTMVTGHSLGGGLALSVSVHHGVAAITFDPSPRIFAGIGDLHEPAERLIVYEDGEILQLFREHWKKLSDVVEPKNIYRCSFNFPGSQHRSDYLALGLLKLGASANPALKPVIDALPMGANT
jgi:putative lipase involved disintegration of autophagic bodies